MMWHHGREKLIKNIEITCHAVHMTSRNQYNLSITFNSKFASVEAAVYSYGRQQMENGKKEKLSVLNIH